MTFFILGCGGSASGIDFQALRTKGKLIGVTYAGLHTECDYLFALDLSFYARNPEAYERYGSRAHAAYHPNNRRPNPGGITQWTRLDNHPPTLEPDTIGTGLRGCPNAGLATMNIAAHLGARRLILVGIDLDKENRYWCPRGPEPLTRSHREDIINNFAYCAPYYEGFGIEVLNANYNSEVKCFKYIDLEGSGSFL